MTRRATGSKLCPVMESTASWVSSVSRALEKWASHRSAARDPARIIGAVLATLFRDSTTRLCSSRRTSPQWVSRQKAILSSTFAQENHNNGRSLVDARNESRARASRPILMTSLGLASLGTALAVAVSAGPGQMT